VSINILFALSCIDLYQIIVFEFLQDRKGLIFEGFCSFYDAFMVIIGSVAIFSSLQHSLHQNILRAIKINHLADLNFFLKFLHKYIPIFLISGESIEQILLISESWNVLLNEINNKCWSKQSAFSHAVLYLLSELSSFVKLVS